jgi:GcrA cell cycle regulator
METSGMNWTDERVERLKKLWAEGLSASQIAAQLGGVSRNAVIGKVHRLCLPGRAKAGGSTVARTAPKRTTSAPRAQNFASRVTSSTNAQATMTRTVSRASGATMLKEEIEIDAEQSMEIVPVANVVVPMSRRLALTELNENTCKWPIGDPMKEEFHFCGNDAPQNGPYCSYHSRLAYQPSAERRRPR